MDDDDAAAHSATAIDPGAIETTIGAVSPIRGNVVGTIVRGARAAATTHHQSTRRSRKCHAAETGSGGVRDGHTVPTITTLPTGTAIPTSATAGIVIVFCRVAVGAAAACISWNATRKVSLGSPSRTVWLVLNAVDVVVMEPKAGATQ